MQDTRLVVGLPMLTSPGNLRFWAALCDCPRGDAGVAAVLADFERAAAAGKPQLRQFCREWNADLLRKVTLHIVLLMSRAAHLHLDEMPHMHTSMSTYVCASQAQAGLSAQAVFSGRAMYEIDRNSMLARCKSCPG